MLCPEQVGFAPVVIAMDTDGTRAEFTVIVIGALLAFTGEAHGSFDTISQVTASALTRVVETNVEFVSLAIAAPFRFHW
jgi:ACT domain-containing protein